MYLTEEEERILKGEYGETVKRLMEILVRIGEIEEARRTIEVASVHTASTAILKLSGEEGMELLEEVARSGVRYKVPTATDTVSIDIENWRGLVPETYAETQLRSVKAQRKLGVIETYSCTLYLNGIVPRMGEHVAWVETSAVIFANSYLGARSNREVDVAAIAAAICGRVPEYGFHLEENRRGQVLVEINTDLRTHTDYDALGDYIGRQVRDLVPVFANVPRNVSMECLISLGAALATSGAVAMFHIIGVTPEAPSMERAFGGNRPFEKISVTAKELKEAYEHMITGEREKVDFVALGCPHYTINQVKEIAQLLDGGEVKENVELWVCTSRCVKELARRAGYVDIIERAGGRVVCDTCMVVAPVEKMGFKTMATDSAKAAYYCSGFGLDVWIGTTKECVKTALK